MMNEHNIQESYRLFQKRKKGEPFTPEEERISDDLYEKAISQDRERVRNKKAEEEREE